MRPLKVMEGVPLTVESATGMAIELVSRATSQVVASPRSVHPMVTEVAVFEVIVTLPTCGQEGMGSTVTSSMAAYQ